MDRKIWIVGAGGFAFDLASRFVQVPGEGNVFSGFIDSRAEVVEDTKGVYEKYKDRMTAVANLGITGFNTIGPFYPIPPI